ncbi:hypothetical protein HK099_008221 [Clydaea vesicula]|uniref:Uncharacterized protein n=1 Tax=Clydaea vesicula TaxID=447962 RepID=A0AAD5XX12_9FUNG|nr:hypothetical protein HK099_008221 [Clydaea vesicula]KAJ3377619.1 hypothetical protein HDU92_008130 [Lobulomyces angularis]
MGLSDLLGGSKSDQVGDSQLPQAALDFIDRQLDKLRPKLHPLYQRGVQKFQANVLDRLEDKLDGDDDVVEKMQERGILDDIKSTFKASTNFLNPVEQFRKNLPQLKKEFGIVLERKHEPVAQKFVEITIGEAREYLIKHIHLIDIGTGIKGEISGFFKKLGISSSKSKENLTANTRAVGDAKDDEDDDEIFGFRRVLSAKLDEGIDNIKDKSRTQMHETLYDVEEKLYEEMPEGLQKVFDLVFGGNPFDSDIELDNIDKDSSNPLKKFRRKMRIRLNKLVEEEHINLENQCIEEFKDTVKKEFGLTK